MLKIGDFSKLSMISVRMLRHYDENGLLVPVEVDRFSGYRYYSEEQLGLAMRITALRDIGFGVSAIREIIERSDDTHYIETMYIARREERTVNTVVPPRSSARSRRRLRASTQEIT